MAHIDEGTIHAWLDGALPPDEGQRLEAHVATCAECSAAVAEARGLIAASSRILAALDDVPAGVIPHERDAQRRGGGDRAAPVAPVRATRDTDLPAQRTAAADAPRVTRDGMPRRRPWYLRAQFAAAASIAFVAVSATLVMRGTADRSVADFAAPSPMSAERAAVAPNAAATALPDSVAGAAPADAPGSARRASTAIHEAAEGAAAGASAAPRQGPPPAVRLATAPAVNPAVTPAVTPAPSAPPSAGDSVRRLAVTADAITSVERARVAGDAAAQQKREDEAAPRGARSAKTVVSQAAAPPAAPPRPAPAPGALPSSLADRGAANAFDAAAATALAGCYLVERSDALRLAGGGVRWQLELAPAGAEGGVPTFVARELAVDSRAPAVSDSSRARRPSNEALANGTARRWRWAPLPGGEVVLLLGSGGGAQRHAVTVSTERDASGGAAREERARATAGGESRAVRISCPDR